MTNEDRFSRDSRFAKVFDEPPGRYIGLWQIGDSTTPSVVGAHAWPKDCCTGVPCPKCSAEIVYNGNYFCSSSAGRQCQWAMSEDDTGILFTRCHEGLLANRAKP